MPVTTLRKLLSHVHAYEVEITSVTVLQHSPYMYVGDYVGNVAVLKVDRESFNISKMGYLIPLSASHGNTNEVNGACSVMFILPQPKAESKKVLIIYRDGFITLWSIPESRAIFTTGGGVMMPTVGHDTKTVTAACWACPLGSKVAVGYSNGEISIWSIPFTSGASETDLQAAQTGPTSRLNLGYKLEKIAISSLKWACSDGKSGRLYVIGVHGGGSARLLQVVLLNENCESRTTKLGLQLPEPPTEMAIISCSGEQIKHRQYAFLVLGISGDMYCYDDYSIERYLLQSQSKASPSLPKEIRVKMPFFNSRITVAKYITDNPCSLSPRDEAEAVLENLVPPLFPFDLRQQEGTNSSRFNGFSKFKNMYITGHSNGAINFWDASSPVMLPIVSITQQSEDDFSLSGIAVTELFFESDGNSPILIYGDESGMIRILKFKQEPFASASTFLSLQGSSKKGSNYIQSLKLVKVNGAVTSINMQSKHLAVGTGQGYASLIHMEGPTLLYQKQIVSEICPGIISVQFEICDFHGFEKNVLVMATKDSCVLALERDTGEALGSSLVHPKKPSKSLFMGILDGRASSVYSIKGRSLVDQKQSSVLLCTEKAAYIFSLTHVTQGTKKVLHKKKFHSSCYCASTFDTLRGSGLILLFPNGKIEIRSLPELSLLKETYIKGVTLSPPNLNSVSDVSVCFSKDGELIMVNGDQEMFQISMLLQKQTYRYSDFVSQVYRRDFIGEQQTSITSVPASHKEKKKGIFSSVLKETSGSKGKLVYEKEAEDAKETMVELSAIFSVENFPSISESTVNHGMDVDEAELDIDDIEIDEPREKPKGLATLNKYKLSSKFKAIKGKLKQMTVKNEQIQKVEVEKEDEKNNDTVDQIKRKYGFSSSGELNSGARLAENKLRENLKKLQGVGLKTTEMQETAESFSSMAKQMLKAAEHGNK
ncbi:uncharacterized protein LOC124915758 isoform X2 [Impatiens glandulifera]|uniref:uncharacterized protein LOC124915758 isoform X2 n=1 Tax=Impatiens glandulifera TaxID=253017 RepID=UPI001FB17C6D|nr:uncharacterized protein LOC124915758 isoform X2 [Impatiens glandulifera]